MTSTDPEIDYAYWVAPGASFRVTYSLPLFHELDFQVNEGYRRIPHGGIEVGGVLFGRTDASGITIEAFRPIDCEHASGPSFILSDRDRARLREQLSAAASDPDLAGLAPLGCFIAHTRSGLVLSERERSWFNEFFPQPGNLMLLVKPERFQPTRFGFLVRQTDGTFPTDATAHAIILPLPGRAGRSENGAVASIPAPTPTAPSPPVAMSGPTAPPSITKQTPPPSPLFTDDAVRESPPRRAYVVPSPVSDSGEWSVSPSEPVHAETSAVPPERDRDVSTEARNLSDTASSERALTKAELPTIEEIRRRRAEALRDDSVERYGGMQPGGFATPARNRSTLRLALVLCLAAALGCAVGYWAYLQLPSATIPLVVHTEPANLLVSWPPEQTRDAVYAAIRVNDGEPVPLSPEQKAAGEAEINAIGDNVKVELIAQHWMRDSRGIVRYVRPPVPAAQAQPPALERPAGSAPALKRQASPAAAEEQ